MNKTEYPLEARVTNSSSPQQSYLEQKVLYYSIDRLSSIPLLQLFCGVQISTSSREGNGIALSSMYNDNTVFNTLSEMKGIVISTIKIIFVHTQNITRKSLNDAIQLHCILSQVYCNSHIIISFGSYSK